MGDVPHPAPTLPLAGSAMLVPPAPAPQVAHGMGMAADGALGFVAGLPPAFSAYRLGALTQADPWTGRSPLLTYFAGLHAATLDPLRANLHLAGPRVMCFEVVARHGTACAEAPACVCLPRRGQ